MPEEMQTAPESNTSKDEGKNSVDPKRTEDSASKESEAPQKQFTQDELNKIIKRELDTAKAKAKKDAEEKAAQERGEFEKLASERKAELISLQEEHDELKERYDKLNEQVQELIKAELKGLPSTVRDLAPADSSLLLEWLPKARKTAEALNDGSNESPKPGNTRSPKPGSQSPKDLTQASIDIMRKRGNYTGF